jgi:hypothetical protein
MWSRFPYNPTPYDDDWEGQPSQGPFYQWVLGLGVPLVIAYFGLHAIITRQTHYSGRGATIDLTDANAVAIGIAWFSAAVFLHCHYFWGNIYDQAWFAVLGKILGAIGFIAGIGVLLVRCGIFGIG